jgi:hypothetical protein
MGRELKLTGEANPELSRTRSEKGVDAGSEATARDL